MRDQGNPLTWEEAVAKKPEIDADADSWRWWAVSLESVGGKAVSELEQKVMGAESRFKARDESPEEFWLRVERLRVIRESSDRPYRTDEHLAFQENTQ